MNNGHKETENEEICRTEGKELAEKFRSNNKKDPFPAFLQLSY